MKTGSDTAPFSERAESRSALSHRTLEAIAKAADKQWQAIAHRSATCAQRSSHRVQRNPQNLPIPAGREKGLSRLPDANGGFNEPMKALLVDELPKGPDWVYEVKFEGIRALAIKAMLGPWRRGPLSR